MISGFHSHYCPGCDKRYECPKITHCMAGDSALCPDHAYEKIRKKQGSQQSENVY